MIATGPDHGIQLASGRLLVPVWMWTGTGGNAHRPSVVATVYSDDHQQPVAAQGAIAIPCTDEWINPNESTVVELASGQVMLNAERIATAPSTRHYKKARTVRPTGRHPASTRP